MKLKLSERAKECKERIDELNQEMEDLNHIVMCVRANQAIEKNPDRYDYDETDYDEVVSYFRSLCAKHEVPLPNTDFIEWNAIEIV